MNYLLEKYFSIIYQEYPESEPLKALYHVMKNHYSFDMESYIRALSGLKEGEIRNEIPAIQDLDKQYEKFDDYRIRTYSLKNFRKFGDKKGRPVGLRMTALKDFNERSIEICSSLFLVGGNGTGKTSLYTGLEYMFTPSYISAMKLRNISNKDLFLPYGNLSMDDIDVTLEINSKENGSYKKLTKPHSEKISMHPFFCSDYDIQVIQQSTDLTEYLLRELGFGEVNELIKTLRAYQNAFGEPGKYISIDMTAILYDSDMMLTDALTLSTARDDEYKRIIDVLNRIKQDIKQYADKVENKIPTQIESLVQINSIKRILGEFAKSFENLDSIYLSLDFFSNLKFIIRKIGNMATDSNIDELTFLQEYKQLLSLDVLEREIMDYLEKIDAMFSNRNLSRRARKEIVLTQIERLKSSEFYTYSQIRLKKEEESKRITNPEESIAQLSFLIDNLEKLRKADLQQMTNLLLGFIPSVLNSFSQKKHDNFNNEDILSLEVGDDFKMSVKIANKYIFGDAFTTPQLYYNSFRFKLYCISLKIALALLTMKIYDLKAPIIIDDVFTASDFDNSIKLDLFFEAIFNIFSKITKKGRNELQLIFFTHDEVLLNCMRDVYNTKENMNLTYTTGRLYPIEELDQKDLMYGRGFYNLFQRFL